MKIDVAEFAKPCPCGHVHEIVVEDIFIESGAIRRLPGLIAQKGFKKPVVICDENTYRVAGEAVMELLPESGLIVLDPTNLHANERAVAMVEEKLAKVGETDVMLAVGSGTVHDATRYVAHKIGVPFISVPTAASVDGFVSTVAAMTWHGCKQTFPAVAPIFVVADSDIFAKAPVRLNASGVMPLIFASAIMQFPGTILAFWPHSAAYKWWSTSVSPVSVLYNVLFAAMILAFTFFYSSISFNPAEMSKNIQQNGGMIPGIRQGKPTTDFIAKINHRITLFGAFFLAILALLPSIVYGIARVNLPFATSSLLIAVSVAVETMRQLESQMLMRHYKGFLE